MLDLIRISRTEMGAYLCIAQNGVPPSISKRIILTVECKWQFQVALALQERWIFANCIFIQVIVGCIYGFPLPPEALVYQRSIFKKLFLHTEVPP